MHIEQLYFAVVWP